MAFEKYKPNTRSPQKPLVRLRKCYIGFNISAAKIIKWDYVNVAVDELKGQIAISAASEGEGLKVIRNKEWGQAQITANGLIKHFNLDRLIGSFFTIEDKTNMIMLTPVNKLVSFKNNM